MRCWVILTANGFSVDLWRVLFRQRCYAGGAAGLTLTAAQAVFLMEPAINPGLEAQAAARIHRLGRTLESQCSAPCVQNLVYDIWGKYCAEEGD